MKFFNYLCALLLISHSVLALPTDSRVPGGIAVIDLEGYKQAPSVMFNVQSVLVTRNNGTNDCKAWVGLPLKHALGQASISVNGKPLTVTVNEFNYPEQRLTVKKKHVNPNNNQMERVGAEFKKMNKVYKSHTAFSDFQSDRVEGMIWRLCGPLCSAFGLRRFFNDQERDPRAGVDVAAPTGAPITSPLSGKVVLTGDFY